VLERAIDVLKLFQKIDIKKESLKALALSLSSLNNCLTLSKYEIRLSTILDVGANIGQFAMSASFCFPDAAIYSFEPIPDAFLQLTKNIRHKPNIKAFNCVLGDSRRRDSFYRNEFTQVSSLYKIDHRNDNPNYNQRKTMIVEVDVFPLDDFVADLQIKTPVLLKMDVQGMEKEVLLGSKRTLEVIEFILLEAPFVPLYENQLLFDELNDYMRSIGYKLLAPVGVNRGKDDMIIEMDLLYKKA
jgi:FkbM family methyltransferase